jgi:hypothetical protein
VYCNFQVLTSREAPWLPESTVFYVFHYSCALCTQVCSVHLSPLRKSRVPMLLDPITSMPRSCTTDNGRGKRLRAQGSAAGAQGATGRRAGSRGEGSVRGTGDGGQCRFHNAVAAGRCGSALLPGLLRLWVSSPMTDESPVSVAQTLLHEAYHLSIAQLVGQPT